MPNIVLKRFMIFNPNDGQNEGCEHDKLLYHWTKDVTNNKVDLVEQIDDICLCDASVAASVRLNSDPSKDSQSNDDSRLSNSTVNSKLVPSQKSLVLTFESTIILIVEAEHEQSLWMAVHVGPSNSTDRNCDTNSTSGQQKSFDPNCIPIGAIERIMKNIYTRFCMINGTFQMIADRALIEAHNHDDDDDRGDHRSEKQQSTRIRNKIRSICEDYFNTILPNIHLNSILSNIASLYNYVIYLDLNPLILLKVNSFINHLVCIDAGQIRHTLVLFNEQLLWSSLNMYDSRLIYNYLVSVLIRDALQEELSKETDKVRRIKENMPIYLRDETDETSNFEETMVNFGISRSQQQSNNSNYRNKSLSKQYMTVFRSNNNMTLALIFNDPDQFDLIQKCEHILTSDSRLGVIPLASLAQTVGHCFLKSNSSSPGVSSSQASSSQHNSGSSRRWQVSSKGSSVPSDQKYLCLDQLNVCVNFSTNLDAPNKEQHLVIGSGDGCSPEILQGNKKVRLIRNLLELEPEFEDMKQRTGSQVEEFFGKTTSDTWLTVTNSKWKSIYSVYKMRNAGLSEAQQCATNLKTALVGHYRR